MAKTPLAVVSATPAGKGTSCVKIRRTAFIQNSFTDLGAVGCDSHHLRQSVGHHKKALFMKRSVDSRGSKKLGTPG
jgi:hypothetical protein